VPYDASQLAKTCIRATRTHPADASESLSMSWVFCFRPMGWSAAADAAVHSVGAARLTHGEIENFALPILSETQRHDEPGGRFMDCLLVYVRV
jgi:hypothetical protein